MRLNLKGLWTLLLTIYGSYSIGQNLSSDKGKLIVWLVGEQSMIRKFPECIQKNNPQVQYKFNSLKAFYIIGKDSISVKQMNVLVEWSSLMNKPSDPMESEGWYYMDSTNATLSTFFKYFNAMPSVLSVWVRSIILNDGTTVDFPQMLCFNSQKEVFLKSRISSALVNTETERRKQRPVVNGIQWVEERNDSLIYFRNGVFFYHRQKK